MSPITVNEAWAAIDNKTKPLGSLGLLENWAVKLIVLQNTFSPNYYLCIVFPRIDSGHILVFAADHGLADEDVSQYPKVVTREMLRNLSAGGAAINAFCNAGGLSIEVVDVGVDTTETFPNITHNKVSSNGTVSSLRGEAMTHEQFIDAINVGRQAISRFASAGAPVAVGIGELGIGNTTTASCLLFADLFYDDENADASSITGAGTGVSGDRLAHKTDVVRKVVERHANIIKHGDWKEVLRVMGGLEIVAMVGAIHEAALRRISVLVDGFISQSAFLYALKVFTSDKELLFRSVFLAHSSAEKGGKLMVKKIKVALKGESNDERGYWSTSPALDLGLRLGEGTGAALAFSLLKAASHMAADMASFESAGVSKSK
ncbi:hypothetical protein HK096_011161 [Nowakowskiella sp. JEL0078]|nr:hypothetical protein HK096_011161 [Nowakowskiella sp. JEL0078]